MSITPLAADIRPAHLTDTSYPDHMVAANAYTPKTLGPKYPPHDANAPLFEGIDTAGLVAAIIITLGPLAAYSLGFGA